MKHTKIKTFVHRLNEADLKTMRCNMDIMSDDITEFLNNHKIEAKRIIQNVAGIHNDVIITTIQYRDTVGD